MKQSILKMSLFGNNLLMIEIKLWNLIDNVYYKTDITLDTGASVTTISTDLLNLLGYKFKGRNRSKITTASGVEFVDKVKLSKLKIGDFEFNDIEVYAHTFPEESFSVGVLGLNVLSEFDILLLFSKRLVVLYEQN